MGTEGYFPHRPKWSEGSPFFDIWALGVIIFEADGKLDSYFDCSSEEEAKRRARIYVKEGKTCKGLAKIVSKTLLKEESSQLLTLEKMVEELQTSMFKR